MKKIGAYLFLLGLLFILLYIRTVHSQQTTGVGLTIIDTQGPIISLIEPLNNSGDSDGNITFFYNASDASTVDNCSLIINNRVNITDNTTIKETRLNFTLNNTPLGRYNWSINCTDNLTFASSSANRAFSVNLMKNFNGTTTNISLIDVRNVTNFVMEITNFGTINFSEGVDLSQGLDLNNYINISLNRIEINSTALNSLNKSATLYLYGLTFTNPRPLRDGAVCPNTICKEVPPYIGGTFVFNVTHFTVYSSEETPAEEAEEEAAPSGGAGGGGSGRGGGGTAPIAAKREFTISKDTLKVVLKQGQTKDESVDIKNTGDTALDVTTYLQALREFIFSPSLDEFKIILNPNEEQTLSFIFGAEEDQQPDIYTGEIAVKGGGMEKIISTIVEVESAQPLFDVDVEVLPQYKSIFPGDDVVMEVSLFNVRGFGRVDVNVEYSIKDFKGNLIAMEEETVAVETQAKFVRELLIPSDIKPGTYIAAVKVTFEDSAGTSSDIFEVKAKAIKLYPVAIKDYTFYLLLGIIFIVFSIFIFLIYEFTAKKRYMPKTKEEEGKLLKAEGKIEKLEKELKALEGAYKSKFISEESYKKGKERIEKEIKKLGR